MQKSFKFFVIILAVLIIVPQITFAAWWNPFTWGWLNRFFHFQQQEQKVQQQQKITVQTDQTVGWSGAFYRDDGQYVILQDLGQSNVKLSVIGPDVRPNEPTCQFTGTGHVNSNTLTINLDNSNYPDQKDAKIIAELSADKNQISINANSFENRFALMRFCYGGGSIVGTYAIKTVDSVVGWKSYTNSQYGFSFDYPSLLTARDISSDVVRLDISVKKSDNLSEGVAVLVAPKNSSIVSAALVEPKGATILNKTEKIAGLTWQKKEVVEVPKNGIGTYGDQMTYYIEKNNLIYSFTCFACVPPPDGGGIASDTLPKLLSTFKFTTPTNQQTVRPEIKVVFPKGGEALQTNGNYSIRWDYQGLASDSQVYVYIINYGVYPNKACAVSRDMASQLMPISQKQITINSSVFDCTGTGDKFKVSISLMDNTNKNPAFGFLENYFTITK